MSTENKIHFLFIISQFDNFFKLIRSKFNIPTSKNYWIGWFFQNLNFLSVKIIDGGGIQFDKDDVKLSL